MTTAWYVRAESPLALRLVVIPHGATLSQRADGSLVEAEAGVYRVAAVFAAPEVIEQALRDAGYTIMEREGE
jgi:hypothetical protein